MELDRIDNAFNDTIRNSDLQNISINMAELLADSFMESGIIKDIPIIGSIIGLGKTAYSIKNSLFLKKVISFLAELKDIPVEKRSAMIDSVHKDDKQKIKVGEKIIYILDKCDDNIDAKYIAQFFCGFLEEKISYEEFLRGARIIQSVYVGDLEYFLRTPDIEIEKETSTEEAPDEDTFPLINCRICGFGYNPTSVEDQDDYKMSNKYVVSGGEAVIWITTIGRKIKEILKEKINGDES